MFVSSYRTFLPGRLLRAGWAHLYDPRWTVHTPAEQGDLGRLPASGTYSPSAAAVRRLIRAVSWRRAPLVAGHRSQGRCLITEWILGPGPGLTAAGAARRSC